ncbi:MAG: cytochrome c5 family protein [Desulfuromonadales bacterium]|nr:cytochrome c5 family protein [Desulfuromonadales bacterium]
MKTITLILALILLTLFTIFTACSKQEEPKTVAEKKTPPIQAAEKAAAAANNHNGQTIYADNCASCHNSGVMKAPKIGDTQAWTGLIAEGSESLTAVAINGKEQMPPKGGNMLLSDAEVKAAVDYMIEQSR